MILTTENTFKIGKPVTRVVDANGLEYTYTNYIDTVTGLIKRLKTGVDGKPQEENGEFPSEEIQAAPPIVVFYHKDE